jgi:thioredoxin-like negative regulator of GroEL
MRHHLLLLMLMFALIATSCTPGRGREVQNAPAPAARKPLSTSTKSVVEITDENYEEVVRSQSVVLLLFWAPWSAPDRPMLRTIDVVSVEYSGRATIAKVDVDENPAVAKQLVSRVFPR